MAMHKRVINGGTAALGSSISLVGQKWEQDPR